MKRRQFLKDTACGSIPILLSPFPVSFGRKQNKKRPNILWIISEDTSPDFACYGSDLVKTPNVDRLASQGMLFSNTFASAPVCSASRSAFNTGMYQTSIGAHHHRTRNKLPLPHPVKIAADYFREAGYYTSNCRGLTFDKPGKTDWNFTLDHNPFDGTDWKNRRPGQPFFAQVNLALTHRDFQRDPENPINSDSVRLPPFYPDHPLMRRDWADYLESIQILDRRIGRILERLDEENLIENTIVFYFGDHGRPHLWGKQWLYEGGIKVPFIIRWPGRIKPGVINEELVSMIDFLPTSLSLAGISKPQHMQGKIFLGDGKEHRDYIFAARDRCDETVDRIRCVRSKEFKYIRNFMPERPYTQFNTYKMNQYPAVPLMGMLNEQDKLTDVQARFMAPAKPKEELYDMANDAHETKNLAGDGKYQNVLRHFRNQLDSWMKTTKDLGHTPESS